MKPSEKRIDRVDQFFKNKLDDHTIAPSENAWAKVEAGLSKKNNVVLWRWAAAVLLMGALITIIYQSQTKTESQPVLAEKKFEKTKAESNSTEPEKSRQSDRTNKSVEAQHNTTGSVNKNSSKGIGQPNKKLSEEIKKRENVAVVDPVENKVSETTNLGVEKIEEKIKVEATRKTEVASGQQKPIKLEFTLEDLPSVETVATTNEVKNTGLKKVLELAREMKEGEGPLTSLKEKKNELFAHNFITGRERNQ